MLGTRLKSFHDTHVHLGNSTEGATYLGILTIGLAVAWLVIAWRRRRTLAPGLRAVTAGLLTAFVAGLLFAAPSPIHLLGSNGADAGESAVGGRARVQGQRPLARAPDGRRDSPRRPCLASHLDAAPRARIARPRGRRNRHRPLVRRARDLPRAHFRTSRVRPSTKRWSGRRRGSWRSTRSGYSDIYRLWQRMHRRPLVNGAPAKLAGQPGAT